MIKKVFLILIALGLNTSIWADNIAILISNDLDPYIKAVKGFKRDTPYKVETFNLLGDERKGEQFFATLDPKKIDLLVLVGIKAIRAAQKNSLPNMPVLYTMVHKPQDLKKFKSSTGLVMEIEAVTQFKKINRMLPDLKKIGVFYHPANSQGIIDQAITAAKQANLELIPISIQDPSDLKKQLETLSSNKIDGIWSVADPMVAAPKVYKTIIDHSITNKLPLFSLSESYVRAGALAAFSVDYRDMGKQAAEIANALMDSKAEPPKPKNHPRLVMSFINSKTQKKIKIHSLSIANIRVIQ